MDNALVENARAWPFEEARKLVARFRDRKPEKGYVLFETGYGPSGLPHIGTFGEVVRTTFVRHAFQQMSDIPTKLFCFSDDMDGMRKVPENVPNREMLAEHLGKPLTAVPDPFGCHESFGHHNNAMLRGFLDSFGFDYEFQSATHWYKSGGFDKALLSILHHYDAVMEIMLPSLREERAQTYSPFLPISPTTNRVLQVPIDEVRASAGTILFKDEDGKMIEQEVTGGKCKLQWKPDWGMRWHALQVDYEMSGKEHILSVELGSKICKVLGSRPPEGFHFELFLDEQGRKISKSVGNGLSVEEWLTYAPPESLALFMYQRPRVAKRLYFDVIPKAVDEYVTFREKWRKENRAEQLENPAWHIHLGNLPPAEANAGPVDFAMLLNLASVCNAEDKATLLRVMRQMPNRKPPLFWINWLVMR
jgi:lysyl-tRNA synthetase, class I